VNESRATTSVDPLTEMRFSVVGLGKLGASMAAAIASRGFMVTGVDVNERAISLVERGCAPVQETGLAALIAENAHRLHATRDYMTAVAGSDVTFVVVPTPSDERGAFSLEYAKQAFRELGRALAAKPAYHLVVLASTVLPGAGREALLPILERESGKVAGRDFGYCYSPEFIALGSVIRDFLNPDFTLVGELDERAGSLLEGCYARILANGAPCRRMSIENAELAKLAVNTYVTQKITFANELAELCELIPGGNVDVVSDAIGLDRRIGRNCLTGGLAYGGPCFPRDNVALRFLARALGASASLATATHLTNQASVNRLVNRVAGVAGPGAHVAVLGLAYKPGSHVIDASPGIAVARALADRGAYVVAYDPLALESAAAELGDRVEFADSVPSCVAGAEVLVITTPDPAFSTLPRALSAAAGRITVFDCWRLLARDLADDPRVSYIPVGRSLDDGENAARLSAIWEDETAAAGPPVRAGRVASAR
jgi:UDPglucose 6-dehydrogenase